MPCSTAGPSTRDRSPTIRHSCRWTSSASEVLVNISGSGFWTPCSKDSVKTSTYPSSSASSKAGRRSKWMSLSTATRTSA